MSNETTPGGPARTRGSRRITSLADRAEQRRAQLGLTFEEVAHRAGMAPHYLKLVEEHGNALDPEGVERVAAALGTTPSELLEGPADGPPGQSGGAPGAALRRLAAEECRDRLGTHGVGRVAMTTDQGPVVIPVNYSVLEGTIVYRTDPEAVTAQVTEGEIAFEVDNTDDTTGTGWSVLVVGTAEHVTEPETAARLDAQAVEPPWAGGRRDLWVRITPRRVTGRVIEAP